MLKRSVILCFSILLTTGAFGFDSFEHVWMGDAVDLKFPQGHPQLFGDEYPYHNYVHDPEFTHIAGKITPHYLTLTHMANRLAPIKYSFGEILAFAGDYFSLPYETISEDGLAYDSDGAETRFRLAFSTLIPDEGKAQIVVNDLHQTWNTTPQEAKFTSVDELKTSLLSMLRENHPFFAYWDQSPNVNVNPFQPEKTLVALRDLVSKEFQTMHGLLIKYAAERHQDLHTLVASQQTAFGFIYSLLFEISPFYNSILFLNIDHFAEHAKLVYQIGHHVALLEAVKGHQESNPTQKLYYLNNAYALDAFADHYLTDLFSAGHMRTPRKEIYELANNRASAGAAANSMHDEDGFFGINVRNSTAKENSQTEDETIGEGGHWRAYGDFSYFSRRTARQFINTAIQTSVDEVWEVFQSGHMPKEMKAMKLIPEIDPDRPNFPPLFRVSDHDGKKTLEKRINDENIHENNYTANLSRTDFIYARLYYDPLTKVSKNDFRSIVNRQDPQTKVQLHAFCVGQKEESPRGQVKEIPGYYVDFQASGFQSYDDGFPMVLRNSKHLVISKDIFSDIRRMCRKEKRSLFENNPTFIRLKVVDENRKDEEFDYGHVGAYDDEGFVSLRLLGEPL